MSGKNLLVFLNICVCFVWGHNVPVAWQNNRPIIGVLAQETSHSLETMYPGEFKSYIAASYVKFLEAAGARVVPVWIGKDKEYYESIVNKTNGLLFPGGATWFNQTKGYAEAGVTLYKLALESNKRNDLYPILGICLGMELLIYAAAKEREYRVECLAQNIALPLEFKPGFRRSKMFKNAPDDIIEIFSTMPVTAHFHQYCLTEEKLKELGLEDSWTVTSLNRDRNDLYFVSSIESKQFPFFGVQFHPEKPLFEWKYKEGINHSPEAITVSQFLSNKFVALTRGSHHSYSSSKMEHKELIWNYPVVYTGRVGSSYEQCYLFKGNEDYIESDNNKDVLSAIHNIIINAEV